MVQNYADVTGQQVGDHNTQNFYFNGETFTRLFVNVPPRPRVFEGRDGVLADLRARLVDGGRAAVASVRGLPGVGKTTLAVELAYDGGVLAHFTGGVLWGDLGPDGDADTVLRMWAAPLGVEAAQYPDPNALARGVATTLARRGRPTLLVLDDAWAWDPLAVLQTVDAPCCAHLLTTREQPLAYAFAQAAGAVQDLHELLFADALRVLRVFAPQAVEADPEAAAELVTLTGCLPLALTLVGRALAAEGYSSARRLRQAVERLRAAEARLTDHPPGAERTLEAAIALSDAEFHRRLGKAVAWHALGAFAPKPADFAEEIALDVLNCEDAERIIDTLCDLGLLEPAGDGVYTIHATVRDYICEQIPPPGIILARTPRARLSCTSKLRSQKLEVY